MFTAEQERVIELFRQGYSFFLTGKGGTGKSFILREVIRIAKETRKEIAVTGPTGRASENIGGQTIHSWAGIGLGDLSRYQLLDRVLSHKQHTEAWRKCKLLIIDEVSLLAKDLFEKLEFIARRVRNCEAPFGGIQLIFSGDFFQIPPVNNDDEDAEYCFQSPMWTKCFDLNIELTEVIRQSESEFLSVLNEVRNGGELSPFVVNMFSAFSRPINWKPGETPLKLFPTRSEAEDENNKMLRDLPGETVVYKAIDGGKKKEILDKKCPATRILTLKIGAPVMLLKNSPNIGLVNGSLGTVVGFINNFPQVLFENGQRVIIRHYTWSVSDEKEGIMECTRRQIPLLLSWGITIHKAQGLTFDKAEICLSKLFVQGQAYVALSRVRKLQGLRILPGFDLKLPPLSNCVKEFYTVTVVPVLKANPEKSPARFQIPEVINQVNVPVMQDEVAVNNWDNVLPLPSTVEIDKIMDSLCNDPLNSKYTNDLINKLYSQDSRNLSEVVTNFVCYCWWKMDQMVSKPTNGDAITVLPKKKWVGHAGELHKFRISGDTVNRWQEVLQRSNIPIHDGQLSPTQRCLMVKVIDKIHAFLIDYIYQERNATSPEEIAPSNVHVYTKECQGKIRYLAGWTVRKEILASNAYTSNNKLSKNKKVIKRCEKEENIKSVLKKLVDTQTSLEYNSKHQASLQYTQSHNRGGLTNVSDAYFENILAVETSCKKHFTTDKIHRFKWDSCKVARDEVKKDPQVKIAFDTLVSSLELSNEEKNVLDTVKTRLQKRYLNMRCKEYVKVLKRKLKCEKSKEHRKKVQGKGAKKLRKVNVIHQIIEDESPNKISAFFTMKAIATSPKCELNNLSKIDLHFLHHIFGMKYKDHFKKTDLVKSLISKIATVHAMDHPSKCTKAEHESLLKGEANCSTCSATNLHQSEVTNASPRERNFTRRKQFRPTEHQRSILEQDHNEGLNPALLQQRAAEFSVDVTQIRSWHTRFKKKSQRL